MLEGGHGSGLSDEILLHRNGSGDVTGAVYFGTQLVIAAGNDAAAVDAFALETRRHTGLRSFVGPKPAVERLWTGVRSWHRQPVLVRARQPLYVLEPRGLAATEDAAVRQATLTDAEVVIENSAQMMLGELGYDPRVNRVTFGASVRRAISAGQWWVWTAGGELRFQLNVGARTNHTAQLQGVWVPPASRGHGYASRGLAAIARRLLASNATLSLYVNDFNREAIAVYERVGFVPVSEMSTLLFA